MTARRRENKIEMERRHIRETVACIARQESVIARLELMGADDLALKAREPLVRFHRFLARARARLDHLERMWSSDTAESD
jgi:hypothetical protein